MTSKSMMIEGAPFQQADEISTDDLKDLFNVLRGQKQGLEAMQETINTNAN